MAIKILTAVVSVYFDWTFIHRRWKLFELWANNLWHQRRAAPKVLCILSENNRRTVKKNLWEATTASLETKLATFFELFKALSYFISPPSDASFMILLSLNSLPHSVWYFQICHWNLIAQKYSTRNKQAPKSWIYKYNRTTTCETVTRDELLIC